MKKLPPLIGLYSPVMQSGKSTIANYLHDTHGYETVKFAAILKRMIRLLATEVGCGLARVEEIVEGRDKDRPCAEFLGQTPRHLMQTLGTDWGRNLIHPDLWVAVTMARVDKLLAEGKRVVIEDVRHMNEYWAINRAHKDALMVQVIRPDAAPPARHECEGLLNDCAFDATIRNDSSVTRLYDRVDLLLHTRSA